MKKYEYKVISVKWSMWTGKAKQDYLQIINEYGQQGWRFVQVVHGVAQSKSSKGIELVLEREVES